MYAGDLTPDPYTRALPLPYPDYWPDTVVLYKLEHFMRELNSSVFWYIFNHI